MSQQKLQLLFPRSRKDWWSLMKSVQYVVRILLISGIALPSRAHKSFCQSLQVSYFINLLILKRKSLCLHKSSMAIIICIPHFSRADFMQLKGLLEKKTTCRAPQSSLPTLPSSQILRAPSWPAHTACLLLTSLVSHPRQRRSQTRSARQILWDWGLIPPCFLWNV